MRRRLTWGEADPAGTVYAPRAVDAAIATVEALWWEALGMSFRDLHRTRGLGTPWVHVSCDFIQPLLAGDTFEIALSLTRLGDSSLEYRADASDPHARVLFRLELVSVMIDVVTMKSCPIPDDIRAGLQAYLVESPGGGGVKRL